jgi:hypothetical protein
LSSHARGAAFRASLPSHHNAIGDDVDERIHSSGVPLQDADYNASDSELTVVSPTPTSHDERARVGLSERMW